MTTKPIDLWKSILGKHAKALEVCSDPAHDECKIFNEFVTVMISWMTAHNVDIETGLKFLASIGANALAVLKNRFDTVPDLEKYGEDDPLKALNDMVDHGKTVGNKPYGGNPHRVTSNVLHITGNDPNIRASIENLIKAATRAARDEKEPEPPEGIKVTPGTKPGEA